MTGSGPSATNQGLPLATAVDEPPNESLEVLEKALNAARLRLQQRLASEIDELRSESARLSTHCDQLRVEAAAIEEQATETAARIVAESQQTAAQMRAEATRKVDDLQTRLRDGVSGFLQQAVDEIAAVQHSLVVAAPGSDPSGDRQAAPTHPAQIQEERAVTRLTVRPALTGDGRTDFKGRLEHLPGVSAAIAGAVDDQSFELLIAHEPAAPVRDSIFALAPDAIHETTSGPGYVEVQLTDADWLRSS